MNLNYLKTLVLCAFAATSTTMVSCSDDDSDNSGSKTLPTTPSGFVILSHPDEVVNGDTATVLVRINPSKAQLTKEQLTVDCVNSDIYYLKEDSAFASSGSASYVKPTSNYTIVDLVPDTLNNDTLQGQWQIKMLVKTNQNIFDMSTLALVASYKDSDGKSVNVSSNTFKMTLVPTPSDGVTAWTPTLYTDSVSHESTDITPYYWMVKENTYQNANGQQINYDVDQRIRSTHFALETIDNDTTTTALTKVKEDDLHVYCFRPIAGKAPFSDLAAGNITNYQANAFFTMTDKSGHEAVITDKCNYSHFAVVTGEVDCPENLKRGEQYVVNLDELLKNNGYSSEAVADFSSHSYTNTGRLKTTDYRDYGVKLNFKMSEDCKTVTIQVMADCEADRALKSLLIGAISLRLKYAGDVNHGVATYVFKLKRKGA